MLEVRFARGDGVGKSSGVGARLVKASEQGEAMKSYYVEEIGPTFGAVIRDCDLSTIADGGADRSLLHELHDHRVLVFPGQHLTHEDHLRVSRIFGALAKNAHSQFTVPGYPEIYVISNIFRDGKPIGLYHGDDVEEWHADHSWKPEMSSASLLYSEIAPQEGGETRFSDTTTAYDDLPSAVRHRVDELLAVHSLAHLTQLQHQATNGVSALNLSQVQGIPDATHPLVRHHPATGRRSLLLGSMIIRNVVGMDEQGSAELLGELHAHATADRYVYRHKWAVGDLVIWDNRAVMHSASPCDSRRNHRLLYRTTVLLKSCVPD